MRDILHKERELDFYNSRNVGSTGMGSSIYGNDGALLISMSHERTVEMARASHLVWKVLTETTTLKKEAWSIEKAHKDKNKSE